jgi:hypothetical protein
MAPFTLIEQQAQGDFFEPSNPQDGDPWLIRERRLEDANGNPRGSFSVRGTYLRVFPNDALIAVNGTNKIAGTGPGHPGGDICTQGVFRFSDFSNPPVVIAIVGGTDEFRNARGTVSLGANGRFIFDVT